MSILQAIILGILQGLAEFLPISSSGHLVIVPWLLGWSAPGVTFDAVLHLGTVVALVVVLWRDILRLITGWFRSVFHRGPIDTDGRLAWLLVLSAIPAAILGFLLSDFFESLFGTPRLVAVLLVVTAGILWLSEWLGKLQRPLTSLKWLDALLMGIAQGIAIAPGISRSGATIATGLARGLKREDAARFSFIMAIPVIVGAAGFKLVKASLDLGQVALLLAGFTAAAVAGYIAVRGFLGFVRRHSLKPFAIYCALAGAATFIVTFFKA